MGFAEWDLAVLNKSPQEEAPKLCLLVFIQSSNITHIYIWLYIYMFGLYIYDRIIYIWLHVYIYIWFYVIRIYIWLYIYNIYTIEFTKFSPTLPTTSLATAVPPCFFAQPPVLPGCHPAPTWTVQCKAWCLETWVMAIEYHGILRMVYRYIIKSMYRY